MILVGLWLTSVVAISAPSKGLPTAKKGQPPAAAPAAPKEPATTAGLPALLQEVERKYAKAQTLTAEFVQITESAALKQSKKSTGRLYVKRPNKIRWETLRPDASVMVTDGFKFWFYTPPFDETEHGQLIERRTSEVQSRLATALLSGSFSVAKDMKIKRESDSLFTLIPKKGTSGTVTSARIHVNPDQKLIENVILQHKDGNRTEVSLTKIRLGEDLGEDVFVFIPPPGTDRVESDDNGDEAK